MKKSILALSILLLLAIAFGLAWSSGQRQSYLATVTDFTSCAAAGYQVSGSLPLQCKTPDGRTFVQDIGNILDKQNIIRIDSPQPGALVYSPLVIKGQARGNWYFEASFPVKILDANGNVLGQYHAQAQGDWMTTSFVGFIATLEFSTSTTKTGTLVLQNDNPSGNPQTAQDVHFPVVFEQ